MRVYQEWSQKPRSNLQWLVTLVLAGLLFLLLIPYLLIAQAPLLDARLDLPGFNFGTINLVVGALLTAAGGGFAFWSVLSEIITGKGTPVPAVPTQNLVVNGPFRYCRNPMTLGTVLAYLGISIMVGTVAGVVLVLLFGFLLLVYVKLVEEKELESRFGASYVEYKQKVPFILPRFWG